MAPAVKVSRHRWLKVRVVDADFFRGRTRWKFNSPKELHRKQFGCGTSSDGTRFLFRHRQAGAGARRSSFIQRSRREKVTNY